MTCVIKELAWVVDLDGDAVVFWDLWTLREPKLLDLGLVWREGLRLFVVCCWWGLNCAAVFGGVAFSVAVGAELTSLLLWFIKFAISLVWVAKVVVIAILSVMACFLPVVAVFLAALG